MIASEIGFTILFQPIYFLLLIKSLTEAGIAQRLPADNAPLWGRPATGCLEGPGHHQIH